ncbi:MAG: Hsp20/alpha crystallin family protein [Desulfuromonadaceae bacterium]|jgi:HSP20 family protein
MTMVTGDLWRELKAMQEHMDRVLERGRNRAGEDIFEPGWQPPADIYENDDEVVVRVEVPDVDQEDMDVQIEAHNLVVQGVRHLERGGETQNYRRIEGHYGRFRRVFSLPPEIDSNRVSAHCDKGILRIVLPKKGSRKSRQIEITIA